MYMVFFFGGFFCLFVFSFEVSTRSIKDAKNFML